MDPAELPDFSQLPDEAQVNLLLQTGDIETMINLFKTDPRRYGRFLNNRIVLDPLIQFYRLSGPINSFQELVAAYDVKYGTKGCLKHQNVKKCAIAAARWGNMRTLQYLFDNSSQSNIQLYSYIPDLLYAAAEGGHLQIIQYLTPKLEVQGLTYSTAGMSAYALKGGHKWLADHLLSQIRTGVLQTDVVQLMTFALLGDLDGFKQQLATALLNRADSPIYAMGPYIAAGGNPDIVNYLITQGHSLPDELILIAAENGKNEFVKQLMAQSSYGYEDIMVAAAAGGNISLVKDMIASMSEESNDELSAAIYAATHAAADNDELEMFKFLISFKESHKPFGYLYNAIFHSPRVLGYILSKKPSRESLNAVLGDMIDSIDLTTVKLLVEAGADDLAFALGHAKEPEVRNYLIMKLRGQGSQPIQGIPVYSSGYQTPSVNYNIYTSPEQPYAGIPSGYPIQSVPSKPTNIYAPTALRYPGQPYASGYYPIQNMPSTTYVPTYPGQSYAGGYYPIQR